MYKLNLFNSFGNIHICFGASITTLVESLSASRGYLACIVVHHFVQFMLVVVESQAALRSPSVERLFCN